MSTHCPFEVVLKHEKGLIKEGNPGLLNYYHPFLSHLHYLLPPSHAILSTSHIGHSPHLPHPERPLDLQQQLEAKVELLRSLRTYLDKWAREGDEAHHGRSRRVTDTKDVGPPRISLMGHSVGSWFLLNLMKRLPGHAEAGYMLFPTLGWIADSWNGRKLWVSRANLLLQPVGFLPKIKLVTMAKHALIL